jgi:DNA-binding LacI/PurR family transcriptional regulator
MGKDKRFGTGGLGRIDRPLTLRARVEQVLREAILEGRWAERLPTEVELADELGVSRETVRRAAETLQREGLVVKIRRRGTLTRPPQIAQRLEPVEAKLVGYLQVDFQTSQGLEEVASRAIGGLMLQGAMSEAGKEGYRLVIQHALQTQAREGITELCQHPGLRGLIITSYAEAKFLGRVMGLGLPVVLLDADISVPQVSSIMDDSFEGARQAVGYLAGLGHRRIAYAHWQQEEMNPWRLRGYRQGLRDAHLPRRRDWEIRTELTEGGARQVVERWLGLPKRPTALYCFNNTLAHLIVQEVLAHGLQVPQDLSVMGAGGEEVHGLTCHQVDWFEMGRAAMKMLLRAVATPGKLPAEHIVVPHTLCVGHTTGARGSYPVMS